MSEHTNDTISRVNRQLARIEHTIEDLMEGVELAEMSSKERLDLAVKLMGQQGRMLLIRQQCEAETPQAGTNVLMAAIMRKMRGETAVDMTTEASDSVPVGAAVLPPPM